MIFKEGVTNCIDLIVLIGKENSAINNIQFKSFLHPEVSKLQVLFIAGDTKVLPGAMT